MFTERGAVNAQAGKDCAADVLGQAGITNPRDQIDCIEMWVPFSWHKPMWLENLGFVPEAALQVRGQAGEHQVDGARTALGHAYGGGAQFFAMWVVAAEKP